MATEERFTSLPTVGSAQMTDIICAVQGYVSPSNLGLSVQETLSQIYSLFQANIILFNSGDPNGAVAGTTFQFCWDTLNLILYVCTTSGTTSTAVWTRANINSGYATTATAAGTTTLTVLSPYWQFFTGSTTQTLVMPVTTTLSPGISWEIVNNSTGAVTIQSSGLNTITTLAAGNHAIITCILASGTGTASWNVVTSSSSGGVLSLTGTAAQVLVNGTSGSATTGAITLTTPQDIATTSSPTFDNIKLSGGQIFDANNNDALVLGATASAVNYVSITNNAAGQVPIIAVGGSDTDIGLLLVSKGNGGIGLRAANTTVPFNFYSGTGAQHTTNFNFADTAANRTVTFPDADGTVAFTTSVVTWNSVAGTTQAAAVNNGYVISNAGTTTVTLPATAALGSLVSIAGQGAGGFILAANTGQTIKMAASTTSSGGSLTSAEQYDTVEVVCVVANTTWVVRSAITTGFTIA